MSTDKAFKNGYAKLQQAASLREILEIASSFEQSALEFYRQHRERVSPRLRPLFDHLLEEEEQHYNMFQSLRQNPEVLLKLKHKMELPPSHPEFSSYTGLPPFQEADDDRVFDYILKREQVAAQQYLALAQQAPAGPVRDLFRCLAQEELSHHRSLQQQIDELRQNPA